ncbi:MAG: LytTR family DNA-binding domain-containing protein, partial [Bacteroidota bacterium]
FLDIQMPGLNGLEWLASLDQAPAVIFTTAHREYALEGFELAAIDYLLKPIGLPRFLKAVNRFLESRPTTPGVARSAPPTSIFIRANRRSVRLQLNEVLWVEGLKDYLRIHTLTDKWVIKSTLTDFAKRLPKADFVRIHRSYIVNRHQIKAYDREEVVLLHQSLPLGRTYRQSFWQFMSEESK